MGLRAARVQACKMSGPDNLYQAFTPATGEASVSGLRTERPPRFESLSINGSGKMVQEKIN
jgi:hypothetical protein